MILNSRPLGFVYDNDYEDILTPNHLLFGRKLYTSNETQQSNIMDEFDSTKRYNHLNMLLSHFWSRWKNEYVTSLREFQKKYKQSNKLTPNINDIVIVYEEKQPRNKWKLGRIDSLIKGTDGQIRGANVMMGKTKNLISRPVNKLYPIEFANCDKPSVQNKDVNRTQREAAMLADLKRKYMT